MASARTQVYLTEQQRELIERRRAQTGESLAEVVRQALDAYLDPNEFDQEQALDATFGSSPGLGSTVPPREEWEWGG